MENKLTEVARSYSEKVNLGNYTSADFFCSQKLEVPLNEVEEASKQLFHFCRQQVKRDIENYLREKENENVIQVEKFEPQEVVKAQRRMFGDDHKMVFDDEPEKEAMMQFRHGQNKAEGKFISKR